MDIWKAIRTVGRRWYISLIVLNLCAAVTASLVVSAEATYTSGATMILLPPSTAEPKPAADGSLDYTEPINPFLSSGVPMSVAVASAANSDRVSNRLKDAGLLDATFTVYSVEGTPILAMSVESNSASTTNAAIAVVVDAVTEVTKELQAAAGASEKVFITAQVLAPPPGAPLESLAAKTKIAMGMVVASFLVVVCAALLFDNLAVRIANRRERRAGRQPVDEFDDGNQFDDDNQVDDAVVGAGDPGVDPDAAFRRAHDVEADDVDGAGDHDDEVVRLKATAGR